VAATPIVETRIKEYKGIKEYDRDARKMTRDGWTVVGQSQGSTHMNVGRTLFTTAFTLGLNLLTPKIGGASYTKGRIVVTWQRAR
jgi:hypothetical protein